MKAFKICLFVQVAILSTLYVQLTNGQNMNTNQTAVGETILAENSVNSISRAQFAVGNKELATNNYAYFVILREPGSGYTWCWVEYHTAKNYPPLNPQEWSKDLLAVPNIGIVHLLGGMTLEITDIKTTSLEDARQQLIAGVTTHLSNAVWPLEDHQKTVRLPLVKTLGDDFYYIPNDARMPPSPKLLELGFKNGIWTIKLESKTAKTNRVAVIGLNSDYKVLNATRSN
jgi:hypothetical protein